MMVLKKNYMEGRLGMVIDGTGHNFGLVHNDKHLDDKEARYFIGNLVKKFANKFASEPIKNPIGQQWVKDHIDLKNRGVKQIFEKVQTVTLIIT